jgi:hypothetical protein
MNVFSFVLSLPVFLLWLRGVFSLGNAVLRRSVSLRLSVAEGMTFGGKLRIRHCAAC